MIDPYIADAPPAATDRNLRQFAALWIAFFGGLACWHGLLRGRTTLALVPAVIAALVGPLGLVKPRTIGLVFAGSMAAARPVGWLVSHLVLAVLFYGVFMPIALLFRLIGRDALALRRRPGAPTCWAVHPAVGDVRGYFRQS